MEKTIQIKISLDDKANFETVEGKQDITDDVFEAVVEAMESAIKETLDFSNEDFANLIYQNYSQKFPENFEGFDKVGFKIEVE
ncbi:hypothetical protein LCGC14_0729820 [marine sediment metagenome]|uniref:Uncharacterized protein n=1 Tax=marine sediment metagenome TaxID=412755 RepID=A0A0F9SV66_9ZZZZ